MATRITQKNTGIKNKPVRKDQIGYGEFAINWHESGPFVQVKDRDNNIIRVGGVIIQDEQPGLAQKGAFWLSLRKDCLFIYTGDYWHPICGGSDEDDSPPPAPPVVNDGLLTIQTSDGTVLGRFTANQAGDTVVTLPDPPEPVPPEWGEITNKPDCFEPCPHRHDYSEIDNVPDPPEVNDGKLTVKTEGGTTLGEFTANQAGPTEVVIPDAPVAGPPAWGEITDKPDCFEPCDHTHPTEPVKWPDIEEKPDCFPPCDHEHPATPWPDIPEKPDCFPPCDHTHPKDPVHWDDIEGKPCLVECPCLYAVLDQEAGVNLTTQTPEHRGVLEPENIDEDEGTYDDYSAALSVTPTDELKKVGTKIRVTGSPEGIDFEDEIIYWAVTKDGSLWIQGSDFPFIFRDPDKPTHVELVDCGGGGDMDCDGVFDCLVNAPIDEPKYAFAIRAGRRDFPVAHQPPHYPEEIAAGVHLYCEICDPDDHHMLELGEEGHGYCAGDRTIFRAPGEYFGRPGVYLAICASPPVYVDDRDAIYGAHPDIIFVKDLKVWRGEYEAGVTTTEQLWTTGEEIPAKSENSGGYATTTWPSNGSDSLEGFLQNDGHIFLQTDRCENFVDMGEAGGRCGLLEGYGNHFFRIEFTCHRGDTYHYVFIFSKHDLSYGGSTKEINNAMPNIQIKPMEDN